MYLRVNIITQFIVFRLRKHKNHNNKSDNLQDFAKKIKF